MNKLQKYINEIAKFLNEKYFCYPLKIMENYFIIETKNAGLVMIRPDLFTCSKTQKWAYEWVDKKEKIPNLKNLIILKIILLRQICPTRFFLKLLQERLLYQTIRNFYQCPVADIPKAKLKTITKSEGLCRATKN